MSACRSATISNWSLSYNRQFGTSYRRRDSRLRQRRNSNRLPSNRWPIGRYPLPSILGIADADCDAGGTPPSARESEVPPKQRTEASLAPVPSLPAALRIVCWQARMPCSSRSIRTSAVALPSRGAPDLDFHETSRASVCIRRVGPSAAASRQTAMAVTNGGGWARGDGARILPGRSAFPRRAISARTDTARAE